MRTDWRPIIARAAVIADSYDTRITLRQLFYRLVSEQLIANQIGTYKRLSELTAQARRAGTFPELVDATRGIVVPPHWDSPADALDALYQQYRRDRTEGQKYTIVLGVEKRGMVQQLDTWFGDERGIPIVPLAGYDSESHISEAREYVEGYDRDAILLYAGDYDPSGEDIQRDYERRSGFWADVRRVALTATQVVDYELPKLPGKATDSRAGDFIARNGELVQVELDALDPDELHRLYGEALDEFWDTSAFEAVKEAEAWERTALRRVRDEFRDRPQDG